MISRYAYSLHEQAVQELVAADNSEREEILALCDNLARSPNRSGAEQVTDVIGRTNDVAYTRHFRITYWIDHAVKEVRIVDVRRY